jgi:rubrerythrin
MESCRCQDIREIEKLEGRVERLRGYNEGLKARVEEFENESVEERLHEYVKHGNGVLLTDDQIDAAVKEAESRENPMKWVAWAALNKLGIFRCEGCGGQRGVGPVRPSITGEDYHVQNKCPDCNAHGWTIRS